MPCDSITLTTVEWSQKNTDLKLLAQALNALGRSAQVYGERIVFSGGSFQNGAFQYESSWRTRVTAQQAATEVAEVKRAYSAEVVKAQAKKWNWQLKEVGKYQYEVIKR